MSRVRTLVSSEVGDAAGSDTYRRQDSVLRFLKEFAGAVHCAVSIKLASDLSYVSVNQAARDLFGPAAGAIGMMDTDLLPARRARRIAADDRRVIASGVPGPVVHEELPTSRGPRTFATQKIPVLGPDGTPYVLIILSDDVTARNQLLGNAQMWDELFSNSDRGIVVGRPDGTTLELMNSAFALLFGSTVEELAGRPMLELFQPAHRDNVLAMLEIVRTNGQHRFETVCRRKDGSAFPAVVEATSAKDANGKVHYRVIRIEDVSLLKSQERAMRDDRDTAKRANTAKNFFIAGLSHELRTPLNVILSFTQVVQLESLTPIQAESLAHIRQAGNHLLAIIDEALDISSVESGRIALRLEPVRVASVVKNVLELTRPLAETAGIRLVNESKGSRACAVADKHRLQQVLLNLTTNAINYNVPGGEVRFRIGRHAQQVSISAIDSGVGIPEGCSHRLFVPFDRLGREASDVEGTGLGLSLSKGLVEAMGGTIVAVPNVGAGTTFTVTLAASPPNQAVTESMDSAARAESAQKQVLFIGDSLASLRLLDAVQRLRTRLRVVTAIQAGIGLQLARHHRPDVIVLDAYLPDLTGEETMRRLSTDPRTREIPVIMASSRDRAGGGSQESGAGFQLTRPVKISALLATIDLALQEAVPVPG